MEIYGESKIKKKYRDCSIVEVKLGVCIVCVHMECVCMYVCACIHTCISFVLCIYVGKGVKVCICIYMQV